MVALTTGKNTPSATASTTRRHHKCRNACSLAAQRLLCGGALGTGGRSKNDFSKLTRRLIMRRGRMHGPLGNPCAAFGTCPVHPGSCTRRARLSRRPTQSPGDRPLLRSTGHWIVWPLAMAPSSPWSREAASTARCITLTPRDASAWIRCRLTVRRCNA